MWISTVENDGEGFTRHPLYYTTHTVTACYTTLPPHLLPTPLLHSPLPSPPPTLTNHLTPKWLALDIVQCHVVKWVCHVDTEFTDRPTWNDEPITTGIVLSLAQCNVFSSLLWMVINVPKCKKVFQNTNYSKQPCQCL